mmetsp:Transcript_3376/g.10447  ORF Transcript_3376/g.10447 Transcript_3376/m.10447 type:complete len:478 (+) Transcript_3376:332-1765(+)
MARAEYDDVNPSLQSLSRKRGGPQVESALLSLSLSGSLSQDRRRQEKRELGGGGCGGSGGPLDVGVVCEANGGKGAGELIDVGLEGGDLGREVRGVELFAEVLELPAGGLDIAGDLDAPVEEVGDGGEVGLLEAARGEGGRAHADAGGREGGFVAGHGVLVERDGGELEDGLDPGAVDVAGGLEVDEAEVIVGAAGDERVAASGEGLGEGLGVGDDLSLVVDVFRRGRLAQGGRERGDGVVVGPALESGEDGEVDGSLEVVPGALPVEDHRAARPPQRLVRRGGDDVRVVEGGGDDVGGDQARDVSHVGEQKGAVLVGDLSHSRVIYQPRVRRGARDDELRPKEPRRRGHRLVVDDPGRLVESVRHGLEKNRRCRDLLRRRLISVREVAAVRQVQRHDPLVRLQQRRVHLEVRRRPRERLDVDAPLLGVERERLQSAPLAQFLHRVDVLVPAVVPRPRVALRVLVRQHRPQRVEHGL